MPNRTPAEREAGIRKLALVQKARYPWRGDYFTFDQVLFLIGIIDEVRAGRDRLVRRVEAAEGVIHTARVEEKSDRMARALAAFDAERGDG